MSFNIRNGQTIDVAVQPGQSIGISSITGTVTATVITGTSAGTSLLSASTSGGVFGPYASGAVVRLTAGADSIVDYDTGVPPLNAYDSAVKAVFNQNGDAVALNIGGLQLRPKISALSSTTILGDSILANGFDAAIGSQSQAYIGWLNDCLFNAGVGFDVVSMLAVGGATLDNVIALQLPTALMDGTDVAWLHAGVNNFNAAATNEAISVLLPKLQTIIAALSAAKKLVIVDSLLPMLNTGSAAARLRSFEFPSVNGAIAQICAKYPNVLFNDEYTPMIDTTSVNLNPLTGYINTTDGIHPTTLGAQSIGYYALRNLIANNVVLTRYKTPGSNLLPAFAGTGGSTTVGSGSISGTPPVGWNCQVVSGAAAVTISSLAPDMIRLSITNAGGAASTVYIQPFPTTSITAAMAAGGLFQAGFGFQASGITGVQRIYQLITTTGATMKSPGSAGVNTNWFAMAKNATNEPTIQYPSIAHGGFRMAPPAILTPGVTNFQYVIGVEVRATDGAVTLDLYNPTLNLLT